MTSLPGIQNASVPAPYRKATVAHTANPSTTVDGTGATFAATSIGTPDSDRFVVVGIIARAAVGTLSVDSVSVGGISATHVVTRVSGSANSWTYASLWIAAVPTGSTADIVTAWSGTVVRQGLGVWAVTGLRNNGAATATGSATTDPLSAALDIAADGIAVGIAATHVNGATFTWTNLTQNYSATVEALTAYAIAAASFAQNQTALTLTADASSATNPVAVFASFR